MWSVYIKTKPDLILLDMKMPDLNGIEFLQYLHLNNLNIPVIVITGSDSMFFNLAKELGVKTILEKPINDSVLVESVKLELTIYQLPNIRV